MNNSDKRAITSNIDKLIEGTDVGSLLPKLVEKDVFLESMVFKYQNCKDGVEINMKRDLYLDILTRGPAAFKNLISALHDSGHYPLATLLDPEARIVPNQTRRHRVHPFCLPNDLGDPDTVKIMKNFAESHPLCQVNLRTVPLKIHVNKSTKQMDYSSIYKTQIYPVSSRPKGYAMIINIKKYNDDIKKERFGAEHDENNLKILFHQLGYSVISHENLTKKEMIKELRNFAEYKDHSRVDSCILAILSHGEQVGDESHFVAADGERVGLNTVLELFSNEKCDALRKKPKIFLFQCCRGDGISHGIRVEYTRTRTDGVAEVPLRTYSDMLIAYSTVNGYRSHRDLFIGTWFIQAVCEVFMEHACDTEIMEMLKLVDTKLENWVSEHDTMQTTCFENRGFKTFFFNPGIYDDGEGDR